MFLLYPPKSEKRQNSSVKGHVPTPVRKGLTDSPGHNQLKPGALMVLYKGKSKLRDGTQRAAELES